MFYAIRGRDLLIWSVVLVDYAELVTLDFELYEQPGGKKKLVKQLDHAVRNVGEWRLGLNQGRPSTYVE